jgi:tetratricopeptide (TPR) repeat protein
VAIDREKVLLAAQGFIQKKRYDKAVAEYQKIIQQDPDDARTLLKIGDLQSKMEAHADAVATYDRVGKYYAAQGFALKAIAVYKQIREIIQREVPQIADRYGHITLQLAQLYEQLGITNDALAAYDEIATQLQRAGQDAEALDFFRKLVELDEFSPLAHLRLAEAYSRVKSVDDAIRHFSIAAQMLMKANRHDDALKVFERLLHHRPEPIYARRAAEIYLERGKPNDGMLALAKLQICFQADPKSLETLSLLARAFVVIGQPSKSIEVQKELARTAKEQGNHGIWRETVNKLLQVAPNDEQVQRLASSPPGKSVSSVPAAAVAQVSEPAPSITETETEIEELSADDIELDRGELSRPPAGSSRGAVGSSRAPVGSSRAPVGSSRAPATSARTGAGRIPDARAATFSAPEVEVAEASLGPGEVYADENIDPSLHPRRILSDAESYLKLGLQEKAVSRLEQGIEAHPRSIPLRRKLRDVVYEAGDHPRTADQMVAIAGILIEDDDIATAAEELSTVLSFVPGHGAARQMLLDLGYELPTAEYSTLDAVELAAAEASEQGTESGERPSGSMTAVPEEEPEAEEEEQEEDAVAVAATADYDSVGSFDAGSEGSLPRFPMDDDEEAEIAEPPPQHESLAQAAAAPKKGGGSGEVVEDALEEAEFFLSRGLFDDARAILEEHLRRLPDHPLLVERMEELEQAIAELASSSGTRERPEAAPEEPEDRAFDIAASLDALDALDAMGATQPEVTAGGGDQIDVEEVFAKFKAGVRAQVSETDSSTHYDLGLAYREMDLIKDAIDEFELAARDPKREAVCQSMIGMIQRQQGDLAAAIEAFIKGLHAEHKTPDQELSLYYELGDAYEAKGNATESLYYFRKVAHRAPDHEDPRGTVAERIRTLQGIGHRPSRERAVGQSDEFSDAFDSLSGGKH